MVFAGWMLRADDSDTAMGTEKSASMADVTVIRAELIGSRKCTALGITVEAYAPVLEMCRELVGRGHNPARPLHAYRDDVLCLTVSSIGWGAQYTVKDRICHISQTKFVRSKAALTQIIIASPSPQVTTRAGGGQEAQTIIGRIECPTR